MFILDEANGWMVRPFDRSVCGWVGKRRRLIRIWIGPVRLVIASKPPDKEHPYGHGRSESIAGLAVGFLLAASGMVICYESFRRLRTRRPQLPHLYAIWPLVASMAVKSGSSLMKFGYGRRLGSAALKADAWHDGVEIVSGLVALSALALALYDPTHFAAADHWGGFAVGLIVLLTALHVVRDTSDELMDAMPNDERIARIREVALSSPGSVGRRKDLCAEDRPAISSGITHRSRSKHDSSSLARSRNKHPVLDPGSTRLGCRRRGSRRAIQAQIIEARIMMRGSKRVSRALWLVAVTVAAYGQTPPPAAEPEIVMERPDITESRIVVPKGNLQFENGLTWTIDHGQTALDLPETLVRFGVSDRTELNRCFRTILTAFVSAPSDNVYFWRIHEDHNSWLGSNANPCLADSGADDRSRRRSGSKPRQTHRFYTSDTNAGRLSSI